MSLNATRPGKMAASGRPWPPPSAARDDQIVADHFTLGVDSDERPLRSVVHGVIIPPGHAAVSGTPAKASMWIARICSCEPASTVYREAVARLRATTTDKVAVHNLVRALRKETGSDVEAATAGHVRATRFRDGHWDLLTPAPNASTSIYERVRPASTAGLGPRLDHASAGEWFRLGGRGLVDAA